MQTAGTTGCLQHHGLRLIIVFLIMLCITCVLPSAADGGSVQNFQQLQTAITSAEGPTTIIIGANIDITEKLHIGSGKIITLTVPDAECYTLTRNSTVGTANNVLIISGGNLTVRGNGTGSLTLHGKDIPSRAFVKVENGGDFTLGNGGIITNSSSTTSGGGVSANKGNVTMDGGTIMNCHAAGRGNLRGGGVYIEKGKLAMYGTAEITNCYVKDPSTTNNIVRGGGVELGASSPDHYLIFTMSDSAKITNCRVISENGSAYGGGIAISVSKATFSMSGSAEVSGCTATSKKTSYGGGIYLAGDQASMSGSATVTGNTADAAGGIFMQSETVTIAEAATVTGNIARKGRGGELYLYSPSTITTTISISGTAQVGPNSTYLRSNSFINVTAPLTGSGGVVEIISQKKDAGTIIVQLYQGATDECLHHFTLHSSMSGKLLKYFAADASSSLPTLRLAEISHTITAETEGHGLITPSGVIDVPHAGSQTFTFTPENGYMIATLIVDGVPIPNPPDSYTFPHVTTDHHITVTFREIVPPPAPPTGSGDSSEGDTETSFRVLFMDGASTFTVITGLSYGDVIKEPAVPEKSGYTFGGWYRDESLIRPWNFADIIPGDLTLYAAWTIIPPATVPTETKIPPIEPTEKPTYPLTTIPPSEHTTANQSKPTESPQYLGPIIAAAIAVILLTLFLLLPRRTVTFLVPSPNGIRRYRIKIRRNHRINRKKLPKQISKIEWYLDPDLTEPWIFDQDTIRENITLYPGRR